MNVNFFGGLHLLNGFSKYQNNIQFTNIAIRIEKRLAQTTELVKEPLNLLLHYLTFLT